MVPVNLITSCQIVRVQLPLTGRRVMALDSFPVKANPPEFELRFYPGQLPVNELDHAGQCSISFDVGGLIYVVRAKISEVLSDNELRLMSVQSYSSDQKRQHFRVDTELFVNYCAVDEEPSSLLNKAPDKVPVNISGGGIKFPVSQRFNMREKINLKLFFEEFPKLDAECIGEVVRLEETNDGHLQVCLQFVDISQADQDRIISYCFAKQRELLRSRVQVKAKN